MFDLSIDDGIARLTLSRPEARNAIPSTQWTALEAAVAEAERGGARILFVLGARGAFCAGADLTDFEAMRKDPQATIRFRQAMRAALNRLRDCAMPTVAVVEGPCFGAGVALAMACDIRLAGSGASFAITPAKIGISYPQEDIHNLVALVGRGQAARLLFTAAPIDGPEAARIGLVELDVGTDVAGAIDLWAKAVTANSATSLKTLKRGIRLACVGVEQDDALDERFDALFGSEDLVERLAGHRQRARK